MSRPLTKPRHTPPLPSDLHLPIISFLSLTHLSQIQSLRTILRDKILLLLKVREKVCFGDIVWNKDENALELAYSSEIASQDASTEESEESAPLVHHTCAFEQMGRGFPQIYHDFHDLQQCEDEFLQSIWKRLRKYALRKTASLGFSLESFSKLRSATQVSLLNIPLFASDWHIALNIVKVNLGALHTLPEHLRENRAFQMALLKRNGEVLKLLPVCYAESRECVKAAYASGNVLWFGEESPLWNFVSPTLKEDREFVFEIVNIFPQVYRNLDPSQKADKEIVLCALRKIPQLIREVPVEFRADRSIIYELMASDEIGDFFVFATEDLKADREFALQMVRLRGQTLQNVAEELKHDRELVREAVLQNPNALTFAAPELQMDPELFLLCARSESLWVYPTSIDHMPRNEEVLLEMQRNPKLAKRYVNYWKNDRPTVLSLLKRDGWLLHKLSDAMKQDREVCLTAVQHDIAIIGDDYTMVPDAFLDDAEFMLDALRSVKHNEKVVTRNGIELLRHLQRFAVRRASENVRSNAAYVIGALEVDVELLQFFPEAQNDRDIMLRAIALDPKCMHLASDALKSDEAFVLDAIRCSNGKVWEALPGEMLQNERILMACVKRSGDIVGEL